MEGIVFNDGGLDRRHGIALGDVSNGRDLRTTVHDRQRQAGIDVAAIDEHDTGPALAAVAVLPRGAQAGGLAQRIEQGDARFERQRVALAIDVQCQEARRPGGSQLAPMVGRADCMKPRRALSTFMSFVGRYSDG